MSDKTITIGYRWIATPAPLAGRYDDINFFDANKGIAINGNSQVLKTEDGAASWKLISTIPGGDYLRCLSMVNESIGWLGCITSTPGMQLLHTTDGGQTWNPTGNLPEKNTPSAVCGLHALDENHIFAAGTNYPERPTGFLKTSNGGKTWTEKSMEDVATLLVDVYFKTELEGWVVGGRATRPNARRNDVVTTILKTVDGGETWQDMIGPGVNPPLGEWGWKIQFLDDKIGFVSTENFTGGAIYITEDGGDTWERKEVRDSDGNIVNGNLEGIGFINRNTGWVGGWGDEAADSGRTSYTTDGGKTWTDVTGSFPRPDPGYPCKTDNPYGQYINRFRVIPGTSIVYASGNTVYKYTNQPTHEPTAQEASSSRFLKPTSLTVSGNHTDIPMTVPAGTKFLSVIIFDRFAGKLRTLLEEDNPTSGERTLTWDMKGDANEALPFNQFMVRVMCDSTSESRLIFQDAPLKALDFGVPHVLR
jgi:photosystem II stability/assembly factor-like uncharacterized protein